MKIALFLLALAIFVCPLSSADNPAPALTAADAGAFLDGVLPLQLEREDIAGAVVVIVKDGSVLFAKGYGFADVSKRIPVSAEETLFRPGSISKLFTWTSVMQLVEQGKLDLERDVNDYLDFKIPATYSEPITIRNIMTHTPGFEETAKDLFATKPQQMIPLDQYLRSHIPDRIFPPGTIPAYSNYATALAGYIVARVSGKSFEDYVTQSIFQPLGMTHSTFQQPLPPAMQSRMSNGYKLGSDNPKPFEIIIPYPAGSLSTTGADMARFMIAHLQNGRYEDARILREDTARLMHTRTFSLADELPGMALGFYEENSNGLRIIGHGGDTLYFHSDLHLIPEKNIGFFISYNSLGKAEISARSAVWEKFLDRYLPYQVPPEKALSSAAAHSKELSGHYLTSRRNGEDILYILGILGELKVSAQKDGILQINAFKNRNGKLKRWKEISPYIYRETNGQDLVVFHHPKGSSQPLMITQYPFFVFDRAPWNQSVNFLLVLLVPGIAIVLLNLILWPIAAWTRRHYRKTLTLTPSESRIRRIFRLVCALNLIFILGFVAIMAQTESNLDILSTRMDPWFHLLQIIGVIAVAGTLFTIYAAIRLWVTSAKSKWFKVQFTLIALACVCLAWAILQNHMLDFSLRY